MEPSAPTPSRARPPRSARKTQKLALWLMRRGFLAHVIRHAEDEYEVLVYRYRLSPGGEPLEMERVEGAERDRNPAKALKRWIKRVETLTREEQHAPRPDPQEPPHRPQEPQEEPRRPRDAPEAGG